MESLTPSGVDLRTRHTVETPESVSLGFEVAGLGSRSLAAGVDHLILLLLLVGVGQLQGVVTLVAGRWATAAGILLGSAVALGYFAAFEAWWRGQTPGKRLVGIRVVRTTGHPVGIAAATIRNLLRLADFLPPPYLGGMALILFHPRSQRLGDLGAGTLVVRDRPLDAPSIAHAPADLAAAPRGARLTAAEYRWLEAYQARAGSLERGARAGLAQEIAARFAPRFPDRPTGDEAFLLALFLEERDVRAAGGGGAEERVAARLIERQRARWEEFDRLAGRAARRGLDSFAGAELPDFAARYREVTADLARARTYRAPAGTVDRLERLATTGHNALYRDPSRLASQAGEFFFRRAPAAIVMSWKPLALALVLLFGPAELSWVVMRSHPELAESVLPDVMLQRAAVAHRRQAEGLTYYEAAAAEQPSVAAFIISNNIGVALWCFAGGILLGVGSLAALAMNGASLGASAAHFANRGVLGYLLTFVAGHGALELFAIAVAGAAGFLLGFALFVPGDHTRSEALALAARRALPMIGGVVVMLCLAGPIEGLASASDAGLPERLTLLGGTLVFLVLYLLNGWLHRGDAPAA